MYITTSRCEGDQETMNGMETGQYAPNTSMCPALEKDPRRSDLQKKVETISNGPERHEELQYSNNEYQDNQLIEWGEDYLIDSEEEQWQNSIFKNMKLQEVQGTSTTSVTFQAVSVPPEDADSAETNNSQELIEQEIEEFIAAEQVEASAGNNANINSMYTPQIGMEFETKEAAQHFFNFYAYLAGFGTAVVKVFRSGSKKKNKRSQKSQLSATSMAKTKNQRPYHSRRQRWTRTLEKRKDLKGKQMW